MKLYCVYTPAHEVLLRKWFLPSVPVDFEVIATPLEISGAGDFLSAEFLRCIRAKISLIIDSIQRNAGSWILWSDVDILFQKGTMEALTLVINKAGDHQVFFQRETKQGDEVNTGFILIRCGPQMEEFFRTVATRLEQETTKNEQAVENQMLRDGVAFNWGYLPVNFVARTHGWPPSRRMAIYHANYTLGPKGVEQKIRQFEAVNAMQRFGWPAILYFTVRRAIEKLIQLFHRKK